jgi:purine-cytosine permease-like protein
MATINLNARLQEPSSQRRSSRSPTGYWVAVIVVSLLVLAVVIGFLAAAGTLVPAHPTNAAPEPGFGTWAALR